MIRAVLLKPLDYRDPDRLVYFSVENPRRLQSGSISSGPVRATESYRQIFYRIAAYGRPENVMFSGAANPKR